MNCPEIRDLLASDYLDGEMGGDARAAVAAHLDSCEECRRYEREVRRLAAEPFRGASRDTAPPSLWAAVRLRIERGDEGGMHTALARAWRSLRVPACVAASAAAAVVAAYVVRTPVAVTGGSRGPSADAEELRAYLVEQYSVLAYNGTDGSGEASDGSSSAPYGTLVEEYLM